MKQNLNGINKLPWGVFAGLSAMLWSFITIGIVAVFVVSSMMMKEVGQDDGLSQSWWLILLYIGEAITIIGFGVSLFFYTQKEKQRIKILALNSGEA